MVDIAKLSNLSSLTTTTGTKVTSGKPATETKDSSTKAEDLKNQFMSILLTQMQHQNPLDPMDTKEFTGQLAQFSGLEQQIDTNSKLDKLVTAMSSNTSTAAFGYIGQNAEVSSKMTVVEGGAVDFKYALPSKAASATIKIKDQNGLVVYEQELKDVDSGTYSLTAGASDFKSKVADGQILTLDIAATDAAGAAVTADVSTTMKVDGVETSSDGVNLRSGGLLFGLSDVLRFTSPTKTETAATGTDTASTAEAA